MQQGTVKKLFSIHSQQKKSVCEGQHYSQSYGGWDCIGKEGKMVKGIMYMWMPRVRQVSLYWSKRQQYLLFYMYFVSTQYSAHETFRYSKCLMNCAWTVTNLLNYALISNTILYVNTYSLNKSCEKLSTSLSLVLKITKRTTREICDVRQHLWHEIRHLSKYYGLGSAADDGNKSRGERRGHSRQTEIWRQAITVCLSWFFSTCVDLHA